MDVTYNFTGGTRAVAQQVNQNFADVKSAVDPLETAVADIESQLTSGIILPDGSVDFTRLQSYATYVVSNATNATPIVITAVAHSFLTGDKVFISGVGGNTASNGVFTITKIGTDTFILDGSIGNGAFTSNGSAILYPSSDKNLISKSYVDNGDLKNITQIGTCSTASATAEKAITLNGFVLVTGSTIQVTFTNVNTATTPTLNVNATGAKSLKNMRGDLIKYIPANIKLPLIYDGTDWIALYTNTFSTIPDRTAGVSKVLTTSYTAESDGYVEVYAGQASGGITLTINSVAYNIVGSNSGTQVFGRESMQVSKGDTYALITNNAAGLTVMDYYFYPMKGAV